MIVDEKAARRLMMEKQGINQFRGVAYKGDVYDTIHRLGCIQIDTVNVVERAHYLTLWSRLGEYEKGLLDSLLYEDRRLFEHWARASSIIPFEEYRYFMHSMRIRRRDMPERLAKYSDANMELLEHVLERIKEEGPRRRGISSMRGRSQGVDGGTGNRRS